MYKVSFGEQKWYNKLLIDVLVVGGGAGSMRLFLEMPLAPQPIFEGFCILNVNIHHLPKSCVVKSDHTC